MARQEEIDFEWALKKFKHRPFEPRYVFLFSGHMIDAPGRCRPRFPPDKEKIAAQAIAKKLDELGAGPGDLALCGGACGGDLLFAEACLNPRSSPRNPDSLSGADLSRKIRYLRRGDVARPVLSGQGPRPNHTL